MANKEIMQEEYEIAKNKFLQEEEEHKELFNKRIEDRKQNLTRVFEEDMGMMKARLEAELTRKKMVIDKEVEVQIADLWKEYDEKVKEKTAALEDEIRNMSEAKMEKLKQEMIRIRELYKKLEAKRKKLMEVEVQRIEKVIVRIVEGSESHHRAFIKKELVDFKKFPDTKTIADEDALKRFSATINKQAIHSGKEYIIYKGTYKNTPCFVKIILLMDRSPNYRKNIKESSKIARNLMSGQEGEPRHSSFIKMHNMFLHENKTYVFMEPMDLSPLDYKIRKGVMTSPEDLKRALKHVLEGLEFMHRRAMAHLNVRAESILFDSNGNAKLSGLGYSLLYFNIDTEKYFKLHKFDTKREFMPVEVYMGDFDPAPVDVYAFGFLLYTTTLDQNKIQRIRKIGHCEYNSIPNDTVRAFVEWTTVRDATKRPKLFDLINHAYFKGGAADQPELDTLSSMKPESQV